LDRGVKTLTEIAAELREYASDVDAECFDGRDAARSTRVAAEIERIGGALRLLFGRRAVETNGWVRGTNATRPEQWYGQIAGISEHKAAKDLQIAERLSECPETHERLRDGSISRDQAEQVTSAVASDPAAESRLLDVIDRGGGMRELRDEHDRAVAAATDMRKARDKAHRERHLRTWVDGAATRGSFSGPTDEVNRLLNAIGPFERQRFTEGRTLGERDNRDAYRFDALLRMADCAGIASSDAPKKSKTSDVTRVRVDLAALLRRHTETGEVCEIPGVGPVDVSVARDVLRCGLLELVITDGVDVRTVVSTTRHIPKALRIALEERDGRCRVRGCDRTDHLEWHHVTRYADGGLTTYDGMGATCPDHHHLIHDRTYAIVVNDDGTWSLRAPPDQAAA
jgi:hypothetical protein